MTPNSPIVYYHTAIWCAPCKVLRPKVEKLCKDLGVTLIPIDIDTQSPIIGGFTSVPAVVVDYPNQEEKLLLVGQTLTISALRKALSHE